jgi:hypothetical protein
LGSQDEPQLTCVTLSQLGLNRSPQVPSISTAEI